MVLGSLVHGKCLEPCVHDRVVCGCPEGKVGFGGLFPLIPFVGFLVQLSFLAPEVAVCAFKALGPADPHLLLSDVVKLQAC